MEKRNKLNWNTIGLIIVVALLTAVGAKLYFDTKTDAYLAVSNQNIRAQEQVIQKLLGGLKNGGDSYQGAVKIADCNETQRRRFDELLAGLSSLNQVELEELDSVFNTCAYYFATIQKVAAAQLDREVVVYLDLLRANAVFDDEAKRMLEDMNTWDEIVRLSRERSELHVELVEVQRAIVDELLAYKTAGHPDVQTKVVAAQEIRDNIIYQTQQVDQLRKELNDS